MTTTDSFIQLYLSAADDVKQRLRDIVFGVSLQKTSAKGAHNDISTDTGPRPDQRDNGEDHGGVSSEGIRG